MKILHLASEYPPQKVFGLGVFVRDLSVEQARAGHEVHVITNSLGGRDHEIVDEGVFVHRVDWPPPPKPADSGATVTQFNTQLTERACRDRIGDGVDVVNAHDWLTSLGGKVLARRYNATFAVTFHDVIVGKRFGKLDNEAKYVGNVEHWVCREADRVICVSEHTRSEVIQAYGADPHKTFAIHNAVSPERFPAVSSTHLARFRRALAADDEKIVLYVGRLDEEKGVDVLLDSFTQIIRQVPKARLVIAGQGKLEDDLRRRALELGIAEKTLFAGYVIKDVLNYLLRSSDVLVVPSWYEPFGIVALEGMICETPVVASLTGGLAEIVTHEENGLLVEPGSVSGLTHQVCRLLSDEGGAARIASAGRQAAQDTFSWKKVADRVATIIEDPEQARASDGSAAHGDIGDQPRCVILVQTHPPDFDLLEANRDQFKALADRGHSVFFLCYRGDGAELSSSWEGIAQALEVDAPRGHGHLTYKTVCGHDRIVSGPWDWVIGIDSDTLVTGDVISYVRRFSEYDAIGVPSTFEPVLDAIRRAGPPTIASDTLEKIGGRYLRGFFYAVRTASLRRAVPLMRDMASRIGVDDATMTACLAATDASIHFCDDVSCYVAFDSPKINASSPVVHCETRDAEERRLFLRAARSPQSQETPESSHPAQLGSTHEIDLSVIVHVRDRKDMLLRLLKTLYDGCDWQEKAEVIVVDYGGHDDLSEGLRELAYPGLRYIYADAVGQFSSAHARNIGFQAARGRWALCLDADLLVPPGFIGRVLTVLRHQPDTAVYGNVHKLMPTEQDRLESGEYDPVRDFDVLKNEAWPHRIDAPAGSILAAPRERLLAVGGYDEDYAGYGFQDIDLIERLRISGLSQAFPGHVFALHQFHGYPDGYNSPDIEQRNRERFLSKRDLVLRNKGREWGQLPQGRIELQSIQWLESNKTPGPHPPLETGPREGIIIWCEGAQLDELRLIARCFQTAGRASGGCRWINAPHNAERVIRDILRDVKPLHRFESHSTGQVVTQFARASLVVLPATADCGNELAVAAERLGTPVIRARQDDPPEAIIAEVAREIGSTLPAVATRTSLNVGPSKDEPSPSRILVGMDEGIGNMVMLTPMLRGLNTLYPNAAIHVLGHQPALQVLEGLTGVARTIDEDDAPEELYDLLIVTGWRKSLQRRLQGVKFTRSPIVAEQIRLDAHESDQHMELVRWLGYSGPTPRPYCAYRSCSMPQNGKKRIGLLDAANPLPQWERKRWPHYRELAEKLLAEGCNVFAFGGQNDAEVYQDHRWPEGVVSMQGRLSLLETAGAMKQMDVVVANDCGLAHMAAALGTATLVLWGPTSAIKNAPRGQHVETKSLHLTCSPCQMSPRWSPCESNRCLRDIEAGDVCESVLRTGKVRCAPAVMPAPKGIASGQASGADRGRADERSSSSCCIDIAEGGSDDDVTTEVVSTPIGKCVIFSGKERVSQHIRHGGQEPWVQEAMAPLADTKKLAIDVGANLGYHTVFLAKRFAHVIAIEPQETLVGMLKRTLWLNGLQNKVTVIQAVCGEAEGAIEIPRLDYTKTRNTGALSVDPAHQGEVLDSRYGGWDGESVRLVPVVTLDAIVQNSSGLDVGLVKIDVEGYESAVLAGAKRTLTRGLPPVFIELQDKGRSGPDQLLRSLGYGCRQLIKGWDYLYTKSG